MLLPEVLSYILHEYRDNFMHLYWYCTTTVSNNYIFVVHHQPTYTVHVHVHVYMYSTWFGHVHGQNCSVPSFLAVEYNHQQIWPIKLPIYTCTVKTLEHLLMYMYMCTYIHLLWVTCIFTCIRTCTCTCAWCIKNLQINNLIYSHKHSSGVARRRGVVICGLEHNSWYI